jgi:plastocyanin
MRKLLAIPLLLVALVVVPVATGADVAKTVKVRDDFFKPVDITISKGKAVKWSWGDGTKHKHSITEYNGKFSSGLKKTGTYKHTFNKGGKFTVICSRHPNKMIMKVTVTK